MGPHGKILLALASESWYKTTMSLLPMGADKESYPAVFQLVLLPIILSSIAPAHSIKAPLVYGTLQFSAQSRL